MSKGPFHSLNICCPYGSRISGFKNTMGNLPLCRYANFYMAHNIWCHSHNIWKIQILNKSHQRELNSIPTLHHTLCCNTTEALTMPFFFTVPLWLIFSLKPSKSAFFRLGELVVTFEFWQASWGIRTRGGGGGIFGFFSCLI